MGRTANPVVPIQKFEDLTGVINKLEIKEISLAQIEVGKRFREDLGDLVTLSESIRKEGLIHPVAVCLNKDAKLPYRLVAGGRRYFALKYLCDQRKNHEDIVSCRIFPSNLSELQLRVLEFAENLYRKDMTWQEECNIKEHIQNLQQKIHGVKTSTAPNAPGWSLSDLSKMTGKSKGSLSGDISLAKMMQSTPEIDWQKFKTKNDAQKAIKHAKKTVEQSAIAKQAKEIIGTGDSKKKKLIDSYHVKDFFQGVKKLGNSTMDFIEIDPPYGISLEDQKAGYSYTGYNEIPAEKYPAFMQHVFQESFRVLKPNHWMICWFGPDPWFEDIHKWIIDAEFKCSRIPAIWVKGNIDEEGHTSATGQSKQPDRSLAKGYEMFFMARKGVPLLNKPGASNVFSHKPIPHQYKVHPTERPFEMISDVLSTFTYPGANVLVPFAGSGNTMIAAASQNMVPIGFDLTEEYFESYIIKIHKMF